MNQEETRLYEIAKTMQPYATSCSLHVYGEKYHIEDKRVELLWSVSAKAEEEPLVEIHSWGELTTLEFLKEHFASHKLNVHTINLTGPVSDKTNVEKGLAYLNELLSKSYVGQNDPCMLQELIRAIEEYVDRHVNDQRR